MDTHCRIATVILKFGYFIEDRDYMHTGHGAFYRRVYRNTWERVTALQYVRAVR